MAGPFDLARLTRSGSRPLNEDSVDSAVVGASLCAVVADGLGGHRGGEVASRVAVDTALASFRANPKASVEQMTALISAAQEAVLEGQRGNSALAQMRSTIVVLAVDGSHATWGHVGDSRLYHLRGGRIMDRTRDHSVSQALVDAGEVAPDEQGQHEDRSRLLRSLGKEGDAGATVHSIDALCDGDGFLLCTDGFWEVLSEIEIAADYCATSSAAGWLERLETRVARRMTQSKDNFTALALRLVSPSLTPPAPSFGPTVRLHEPAPTVVLRRSGTRTSGSLNRNRLTLVVVMLLLAVLIVWSGPGAVQKLRNWISPPPPSNYSEPKQGRDMDVPNPPAAPADVAPQPDAGGAPAEPARGASPQSR
ncbi:MAG: protein phosphatase 2C domain-containing protein [Vicinamibacterales bacterium]